MFRLIAFSVVVSLVASSSAFGVIIQGQEFSVGTTNGIHLLHGYQNASSAQDLLIDITQSSDGGGLAVVSAHVVGVTGGGVGVTGLVGTSRLGLNPIVGVGSLIGPRTANASTLLAQARLRSLLLQVQ